MIKFKDFIIKVEDYGGRLTNPEFETSEDALMRINAWIEEHELIVLNIETIMMPDLHKVSRKYGSTAGFIEKGEAHVANSKWFQVFRVWYNI